MKNRTTWGLLAAFIVSIALIAGIAYAYRGDPGVKGPNYNTEVHEQLEAAMEAGDYDKWLEIRKDNNLPMYGKVFRAVNRENFGSYVEIHKANLAGDTARAEEIRAELGLGQGLKKQGTGRMGGSGGNCPREGFADTDRDGLCDSCGKARS
jgi:hypothetical protein